MKHLKVLAKVVPGADEVELIIISQSHLINDFGNTTPRYNNEGWQGYATSCFGFGEVCLISHPNNGPRWFPDGSTLAPSTYEHWLMVNGKNKSSYPISIPAKHWPKVKAAIEAYNEWGKDQ